MRFLLTLLILALPLTSQAQFRTFVSEQLAPSPANNAILQTNGATSTWTLSPSFTSIDVTNATVTNATTTNLFTSNLTLGSLTGFLKATAGIVATALIDLATDVTGTLPVANGGTGATTFTNNRLLTGNGTSAIVDEANFTFDGDNFNASSATGTSTVAHNLQVDGNLNVTGSTSTGGLTASGAVTFPFTVTFSALTEGSVPFIGAAGLFSEDNANFFWDDSSNRLGIGTSTPAVKLQVTTNDADKLFLTDSTDPLKQLRLGYNSSGNYGTIQAIQSGTAFTPLILNGDGGNVGIGTTTPGYPLDVDGDFRVGEEGGALRALLVDATNGRVAIGHTGNPSFELDVVGTSRFGLNEDLTPDSSALVGQILIDGNGYGAVIALDSAGLYFGQNSASRKLFLQTDETNRLTIDGTGNVGIGVDAPSNVFHVKNTNPTIRLEDSDGSSSIYSQLQSNAQGDLVFIADPGAASGNTEIIFEVDGAEAVRIESDGSVGIGTSTPSSKLTVSSTASNDTLISLNDAIYNSETFRTGLFKSGITNAAPDVRIVDADNNAARAALQIQGQAGAREVLFVASNGRIGVGTTSPEQSLHIESTGPMIGLYDSNASGNPYIEIDGSNGRLTLMNDPANVNSISDFIFEADGTEIVRFEDTGRVGIGDPTPTVMLDIKDSTNGEIRLLNNDDSTATLTLGNTGSSNFDIGVTSGEAAFSIGGSEYVRIDGSGNVGIGSTSPTKLFSVDGGDAIFHSAGSLTEVIISSTDGNSSSFTFQEAGAGKAIAGWDGSSDVFKINGQTAAFTSTAHLVVDTSGNVGIGTTAFEGARLGQKLEIATEDDFGGIAATTWSAVAADAPVFDYNRSKGATKGTHTLVADGDGVGYFNFRASDGVAFQNAASIRSYIDGTPGVNDMPGRISFWTTPDGSVNSVERLTVKNDGNVGIGTTTPTVQLAVQDGIDGNIFQLYDTDGNCLYNPEAGGVTVTCSSDARLKTDIKDADSALDWFKDITIRNYEVIASGERRVGVIAQEVQKVHPEIVSEQGGFLSVELPNLWQIVKAIKELTQRDDEILRRLDALEKKVEMLEGGQVITNQACWLK